jgi:5'-nucleotidase
MAITAVTAGATALAALGGLAGAPASGATTQTNDGLTVRQAAPDGKPAGQARQARRRTIDVQILSFNDYHGHLEATDSPQSPLPPSCDAEPVPDPCTPPVGGVEYLAAHVKALRAEQPRSTLTVAAGDLIGGSTFLSGLFQDQPAIESLNRLGLDVSSVGNHEFDEGTRELRRMIRGGCQESGCFQDLDGNDIPYAGADFDYLGANVVRKATGKQFMKGVSVKRVKGVDVGFIGMTLEATPTLVSPAGVSRVEFLDEVRTANRKARALKRRGVKAIVVLLHEGGYQAGSFDGCEGISGPVVRMAKRMHTEIDLLVTGHTHQPYVCNIPDRDGKRRLVTSASSYGQVLTETHLKINARTGQVRRGKVRADNHLVTRDIKPHAGETKLINFWKAISEPLAARVVGTLAPNTDITGHSDTCRCEETPMADLVADAILWGTQAPEKGGAQIAFMNTGGVRASLIHDETPNGEDPGEITFAETYAVAPFNNLLVTIDLTGAQIEQVLNQQYQKIDDRGSRPMLSLGVSEGFTYEWAWDGAAPAPNTQPTVSGHVVPGSMMLNGEEIVADQTYRVATLNFLADGGDSFTAFTQGTNRLGGSEDLENLAAYLEAHPGLTPPPDRVDGL